MRRRRLRPYLRDRLARDLRRYLIEGEIPVASVRQHWMSQIKPMAACAGTLALAIWMDLKAPPTAAGNSASQAFWLLWLVTFVWLGWRAVNWRRDWFVATDKRFLLFYGFLHRRVAMMPLAKVTDLTFHRSVPARIFGYGDFRLESAGQHQALSHIDFIPDADAHYRAICEVLFGDGAPQDEDDLDWGEDPDDDSGDGGEPRSPTAPSAPDGYAVRPAHAGGERSVVTQPRGIPASPVDSHWAGDSIYQSEDLVKSSRLADTGEIPIVVARPDTVTTRVRRRRG